MTTPQSPLIPLEQAQTMMLNDCIATQATETIALSCAHKRVLANTPIAPVAVPPADNSAMDGYALACADITAPNQALPISQRIPAGTAPHPLTPGSCARLFTGATIPPGADTVVMQENVTATKTHAQFNTLPKRGEHIRRAGEDIAQQSPVLHAGRRLQAPDIGLLASVGLAHIEVYKPLKIALLSSGDELVAPGQPLAPGQIYNSNQYQLSALIQQLGCQCLPTPLVADTLADTQAALAQAAQDADIILSTGGVSVGEEDHIKAALDTLGTQSLWRINIKPGKPLVFGRINQTPLIGLPGNPASALVTFCLLARPFILKAQGAEVTPPLTVQGRAQFELNAISRQNYLRARLSHGEISLFDNQSSGVLSSASWANGLAVIPPHHKVSQGEQISFMPFSELFN